MCKFTHGDDSAEVDWLVIAAGRGPDIEALGLEAAGVKLADSGLIEVDGAMRTSVEGVYAIGDLVPGPALAHKASDEGVIAVEDAAGLETHPIEYIDVPRATFCTPNVASFGLTEAQAREQGYDVVVGKVQYGAVGAGTVYGDRTGLVKIVGEKQYGELLGGHIVGAKATELIQELVNVRALEGGYPEIARIDPRAPDAVRSGHGSRPRRRRLADPRLSGCAGAAGLLLRPGQPAVLPGRRADHVDVAVVPEWEPVLASRIAGSEPQRKLTARRSSESRASSACSRCAGRHMAAHGHDESDARGHVRQAHRARRRLLDGGVPPDVRRRARPRRREHGADRRRRLRDAPDRGPEGHRAPVDRGCAGEREPARASGRRHDPARDRDRTAAPTRASDAGEAIDAHWATLAR